MQNKDPKNKLTIIGGGAAGLFCAVNAARLCPDLEVTIFEKSSKVLQKVAISGGGRCNLTHQYMPISSFSKKYPRGQRFVQKLFHHFFVPQVVEWFENRDVSLKTEADGRMFPVSNQSQSVIRCLLKEADLYGVKIVFNKSVTAMHPTNYGWQTIDADGNTDDCQFLCIATGGFPKLQQYSWILAGSQHEVATPVPSLFTFNLPTHAITQQMGISTQVIIKIIGTNFVESGPLLITHWGLSGPAVIRLSAYAAQFLADCNYTFELQINWLPQWNETSLRKFILETRDQQGSQKILNSPWLTLPTRLKVFLLAEIGIEKETAWANLKADQLSRLLTQLCAYRIAAKGKTIFKEEFVTAGGIKTEEINPSTMESLKQKKLYFAGEILNVDGITGGFNFQFAWSSGYVVARSILEAVSNSQF